MVAAAAEMKTNSLAKAFNSLDVAPAPSESEMREKVEMNRTAVSPVIDPRVQLLDAVVARVFGDRDSAPKDQKLNKDERAVTGTNDRNAGQGQQAKAEGTEPKISKIGMVQNDAKKVTTIKSTDIRAAAAQNIKEITKAQSALQDQQPAAKKAEGPTLGGVLGGMGKGAVVSAAVAAFMPAMAPVVGAVSAGVTLATVMGQGTNGASTPSQPVATSSRNGKNGDRGVIAQSAEPVNMASGANNFTGASAAPTETQQKLNNGPGFGRSPSDIFERPDLGRIGLVGDSLGETKVRNQDPKAYEATLASNMTASRMALQEAVKRQEKGVSLADGSLNSVVLDQFAKGRVKPGQNMNGFLA